MAGQTGLNAWLALAEGSFAVSDIATYADDQALLGSGPAADSLDPVTATAVDNDSSHGEDDPVPPLVGWSEDENGESSDGAESREGE